ncbi:MAG: hypothetical protein IJ604_14360 [Prevotella sp.]|nr:hypothetical protein [Prevotella sp.]
MKSPTEKYYLFTLVNISEDLELVGEFENKLFKSLNKALDYMEKAIEYEISAYSEFHVIQDEDITVERIDERAVNLWLNSCHTEAVMYRVSETCPI